MWLRDGTRLIKLDHCIALHVVPRWTLRVDLSFSPEERDPWIFVGSWPDEEGATEALNAIQAAIIMGSPVVDLQDLPKRID